MSAADAEEARLIAAMEKKANAAFEKKRQEALAQAQAQGRAKNFQLSEEGGANAALKRQLSHVKHHDLPSESTSSGAQPVAYHPAPAPAENTAAGGLELSRYQEQQAQRDREFRERHEAAEREKQASLAGFGSSLSKYEEQARQRDEEGRKHREEEERRRQEEVKAQAAKLQAYRDKQAAEEAEFRRRQEEAERSKQDSLNAMKAADEARRQAALARDADNRKPAPAVLSPRSNQCATCMKELPDKGAVNVKGKNYCYGCSIAAQADACYGCGKPIVTGAMMKANNRKYHPDCLKCARCKCQLIDGFRMRGKDLCCVPCSTKP